MAMNTPNTSIFSYAIYIFIASFFIYLDFEFNRLSLFTNNIIWLNPLLRYEQFEPKVKSIKTILKYVDKFIPIHNINSIKKLLDNIM